MGVQNLVTKQIIFVESLFRLISGIHVVTIPVGIQTVCLYLR